jgi:sugar/nucleoside kinase (ribokinase family)
VFSCDKPTAVAQIQINEEGQNRICVIPCANFEFGLEELDKVDEIIKQTELVILQLELRLDITKEIIRRVHGYGKTPYNAKIDVCVVDYRVYFASGVYVVYAGKL